MAPQVVQANTAQLTSFVCQVFDSLARELLLGTLEGINATIFAYGQTGSGKTFTITGGPERYADRGLIPRSISFLFQSISQRPTCLYQVRICTPACITECAASLSSTSFAHTQTASGKTFTITGRPERHAARGHIPRYMSFLYQSIAHRFTCLYKAVSLQECLLCQLTNSTISCTPFCTTADLHLSIGWGDPLMHACSRSFTMLIPSQPKSCCSHVGT